MYRSIEIRNFRGHRKLSLEKFGDINLLTGLNDAGKTSVLEAIFMHACGPLAGLFSIQTIRAMRHQEDFSFGADGENPWVGLFYQFNMAQAIELRAVTARGSFGVELSENVNELRHSSFGRRLGGGNRPPSSSIEITVRSPAKDAVRYHQEAILQTPSAGPQSGEVGVQLTIDPPVNEPLFAAALIKPGTTGADLATGFSDMRKRGVEAFLVEALNDLDPRIAALEILVSNGRPKLHARVGGTLVPFELLGDGPNTVAQYLVAMSNARDGVLLIDEIGNGVHHTVLGPMWKTLSRAARTQNVQIIATTHSQELLTAAQDSIASESDLVVYRLRRSEEVMGETRVATYRGSKLSTALDVNVDLR
ncbi:ATP/GTP-binding protein [Microbacterium sp. cf046]|uniref:AAA family ATPase n=1 Tax=Microbacterium sp. cf046 TaxID=1761803 RepID=UPI0015875A55|nr:ATP-binding protein [Microbacterium sp. cf046]